MTIENLERLVADARRLEAETRTFDIDDDALDPVLEARDAAQEAVTNAVFEILGDPPEWSSLYGYDEALDDCAVALNGYQSAEANREREHLTMKKLKELWQQVRRWWAL